MQVKIKVEKEDFVVNYIVGLLMVLALPLLIPYFLGALIINLMQKSHAVYED